MALRFTLTHPWIGFLMFKTMREAELLVGWTRLSHESQFWPFVELQTFISWFHIETVQHDGDQVHRSVILAISASQLKQLLLGVTQNARVERVQVITPGDLNGSGGWKMEILSNLIEFFDQGGSPLGHSYEVVGGAIYSTVVAGQSETIDSRQVYSGRH